MCVLHVRGKAVILFKMYSSWGDGWATTCCSSRWPKFSSQHPCLLARNCIYLQFQGIWCILLASISPHTYMAYTDMTCADILISKDKQLWKRTARVILKQKKWMSGNSDRKVKAPTSGFHQKDRRQRGTATCNSSPACVILPLSATPEGWHLYHSHWRNGLLWGKAQSQLATLWFITRVIQPNCSPLPVFP